MTYLLRSTVRPLFSDLTTAKAFAHRKEAAREAIAALTPDVGLLADLPRFRTELVETYRFDPLRLDWSARTTEAPSEAADRGAPESTVAVFVPFTGTPGLFDMTPKQHDGEPPTGFVRYSEPIEGEPIEGELVLAIPVEPVDGGPELERQRARMDAWVVGCTADVHRFNRELSEFVRAELVSLEIRTRRVTELARKAGPPHESRVRRRDDRRTSWSRTAKAGDPAMTPTRRGPGRPAWPDGLLAARLRAAVAATPEPRTCKAIAANFRPLSGHEPGVSPDYLRRLRKRIETDQG